MAGVAGRRQPIWPASQSPQPKWLGRAGHADNTTREGARSVRAALAPMIGGKHHNCPAAPHDCGADGTIRARERAIADLAASQHGVVTRRQLVDGGLSRHAIDNRLRAGRLHPLHRGVYLLGHAVATRHAREMAAVLACGRGAVLSHRSAAYLWRLAPLPGPSPEHGDVTVAARDPGRKAGVRVHRARALVRRDVRTCDGVPVTTPARTLLDLAGEVSSARAGASVRRGSRAAARRAAVTSSPCSLGMAGVPAHPRSGDSSKRDRGTQPTRSQAEECLLAFVRAAPAADA